MKKNRRPGKHQQTDVQVPGTTSLFYLYGYAEDAPRAGEKITVLENDTPVRLRIYRVVNNPGFI